jgi:hypothetical protein
MNTYTTVKLTENQVKALLAATWVYEQTSEGLDDEQAVEYGYTENLARLDEIIQKLQKAGWNA